MKKSTIVSGIMSGIGVLALQTAMLALARRSFRAFAGIAMVKAPLPSPSDVAVPSNCRGLFQ